MHTHASLICVRQKTQENHLPCVSRDLWWTGKLEVGPTALNMPDKHPTTELHPQPQVTVLA